MHHQTCHVPTAALAARSLSADRDGLVPGLASGAPVLASAGGGLIAVRGRTS
jgi:hypothetical protein